MVLIWSYEQQPSKIMKKTSLQLFILLTTFFATWLALSQFDYISFFEIEAKEQKLEKALGELVWDAMSESEQEITDTALTSPIQNILDRICEANNLDKSHIKLHVLENSEINAFALPDAHLVVHSKLIEFADTPEELAGVMAHELAHIEENHVMKKLIKEFGFVVLANMIQGGETLFSINKHLTSSAYDRSLESEADEIGTQYLIESKINPEGLSNFLYKISQEMPDIPKATYWISSHPESEERALRIAKLIPDTDMNYQEIYTQQQWDSIKERIH